jgi:hypothetical protein
MASSVLSVRMAGMPARASCPALVPRYSQAAMRPNPEKPEAPMRDERAIIADDLASLPVRPGLSPGGYRKPDTPQPARRPGTDLYKSGETWADTFSWYGSGS